MPITNKSKAKCDSELQQHELINNGCDVEPTSWYQIVRTSPLAYRYKDYTRRIFSQVPFVCNARMSAKPVRTPCFGITASTTQPQTLLSRHLPNLVHRQGRFDCSQTIVMNTLWPLIVIVRAGHVTFTLTLIDDEDDLCRNLGS